MEGRVVCCAAYVRRNAKVLILLALFLTGTLIAIMNFSQDCDQTYSADVVLLLAGTNSLSNGQWGQQLAGAVGFVRALESAVQGTDQDLRFAVLQWGAGSPLVEVGLTFDTASLEARLNSDSALAQASETCSLPSASCSPPRLAVSARGSRYATALAACGQTLLTNGRPVGSRDLCVLMAADGNQDDETHLYNGDVYGVSAYCAADGVAACSAAGIAAHLKSLGVTIAGIFVSGGNGAQDVTQGRHDLLRLSSCSGQTEVTCASFIHASEPDEIAGIASSFATGLAPLIGSACTEGGDGSRSWAVLLLIPLLLYLLWRPITLWLAKRAIEHDIALSCDQEEATGDDVDDVGQPSQPPSSARAGLWRALKDESEAEEWASTPSPPRKTIYRSDEIQPGDLDYEYSHLLLWCCSCCLRPKVASPLAQRQGLSSQHCDAIDGGVPHRVEENEHRKEEHNKRLPSGWSEHRHEASGSSYYSDSNGTTTWERPVVSLSTETLTV